MLSSIWGSSEEKVTLPEEDFVGVLNIVGTIQANSSNSISLTGSDDGQYNHDLYMKYIDELEKSKNNKAILLYVNSPGGTVYESDELYLKLMEYKEKTKRPIYAYFGSQACSGAYYISMAADKIYTNRNTWTGSIGVITFNCARLGYVYKGDEAGLFARVDELMNIARTSLEIKRKVIQRLIDNGLFPFTKRYLGTLRNHFSTIGVNGINEMIRNFTNDEHNIADQWGQDFAVKFLDYIRAKMVKIQEETGHMYNLEATPAESATYRFAREDKKRFKGIIQAGTEENPYYTNSSQLPVGFTDDPFEALDLQSTLQTKYTGGTVLHLYMGQRISSAKVCRDIVRKVLTNYRLPYVTITPTFSVCPKHGYISGEHKFCPICDEEKKAEKRAAASRTEVA